MRSAIGKCLAATGAAAALIALCTLLTVSGGVAQDDEPTDDGALTVGRCLESSIDTPLEEDALIKQGTIDNTLLRTGVTKPMCADMLERASGDAPVRKLVAAQNYVQEIELVEGAMHRAAGETASRETERHFSGDDSLDLTLVAQTSGEGAGQAQYEPSDDDGDTPGGTPGDDDGSSTGIGDGAEVEPETEQAAAITGTVQSDSDASIEERLDAGTEEGVRAGASRAEAAAGSRCSLEVEFLDDYVQELLPGAYQLTPRAIPEEVRYGSTRRLVLSILPTTEDVFEKIKQKQEDVAEASESDVECVGLTREMKAKLASLDDLKISSRDPATQPIPEEQTTVWEWYVTGKPEGRQSLYLDLSYAISPPGEDPVFRSHEPPPLEETISVKATGFQNLSNLVGGDWLSFSDFMVALVSSIVAPIMLFLWGRRRRQRARESRDQH